MEYTDPAISVDAQLELLKDINLHVPDDARARRYLTFIGYHRLMKYSRPYFTDEGCFEDGISFDGLLDLYIFDRKLRLLILDGIERVEVAFRSVISNEMSLAYGPHWYTDHTVFKNNDNSFILRDVATATNFFSKKRQDGACKHYYQKYKYPALPTSWVATETLTFGKWSKVYGCIDDMALKECIASHFSLTPNLFASWLASLSVTRNYCAHHRRFWNRKLVVNKPRIPNRYRSDVPGVSLDRVYSRLAVLQILLRSIVHSESFKDRLVDLVDECPISYNVPMGFPENWGSLGIWQ